MKVYTTVNILRAVNARIQIFFSFHFMFTRPKFRSFVVPFMLGLSIGLSVFIMQTYSPMTFATSEKETCGAPCVCPPTTASSSSASPQSSANQETAPASASSVSSVPQASTASVASSAATSTTGAAAATESSQASAVSAAPQASTASVASSAATSTTSAAAVTESSQASAVSAAASVIPAAPVPAPMIGIIRMGNVKMATYALGAGRFFSLDDLRSDKNNAPDFSFSVNGANLFVTTIMGVAMKDGPTRMIDGTTMIPAPGKWEAINDPEKCTTALGQLTDYLRKAYSTFTFQSAAGPSLCFKTRDGIVGVLGVSLSDKSFVFKVWPVNGKSIPQPPAALEFFPTATAQSKSSATSSAKAPSAGTSPIVMASTWPLEGRGLVAFDLQTARPNPKTQLTPGPENDLYITAYVTQKPEQRCIRVRSGFSSRTQCSTVYVGSTTVNLLRMGSADTKIVEIKKAYGGVTMQDCADAIAKGPVVNVIPNVQSTTVACAQSKGPNGGVLYAKIGGGSSLQNTQTAQMNVTVWMP